MSIDECAKLLAWLQNIFPRQYSAKMTDQRRDDLLDVLEAAFDGYHLDEVQAAYKAIIKTYEGGAPDISMVRNRLQTMRVEQNTTEQVKAERAANNLDGLPEHHPWRGCYTHHEAYVQYLEDLKNKRLQGTFSDYCRKYPAVVWRPWANPGLNRNRWPHITATNYAGWTTDKNGFCVPKVAQQ